MNKFLLFLFVAVLAIGCKKDDSEDEAPKQDYIDSVINITDVDTTITDFEYTRHNKLSKIIFDAKTWTKLV